AGMTARYVFGPDPSFLHTSAGQCHSSGFMICGDDDQCISVLVCEFERAADSLIEVEHFAHCVRCVVVMRTPVDLRSLDHKKEAFFILLQYVDCCCRGQRKI